MPKVTIERKKYASVLEVYPSGLREVWLIIKLPIKPRKNVRRKRMMLLLLFILKDSFLESIAVPVGNATARIIPHFAVKVNTAICGLV